MDKLRLAFVCLTCVVLAACAGSGGTVGSVGNRASDNEAAIANMNLGAGYLRQGNYNLAIERLQRALQQDPRLVEAHTTIALAYAQSGSPEDAEMHYRRATELAPKNGAAANAYAAFLCSRQNRWAEAQPYFRRAADDSTYGTPEVALTNAGICARDAGQPEAAADSFRAALARNPRYPDALINMMELTFQSGEYLQTRAFVQRYLDARPATAQVLLMCFNAERALNNAAAAERCATQLRNSFPASPEAAQLAEQLRADGR
jgi:type IV pilus assembly protein PilF